MTISSLSPRQRSFCSLFAPFLIFFLLIPSVHSLADTFTVRITDDELDVAHGGDDTNTGLSLREAIIDANNNPGADSISFSTDGQYRLTRDGNGEGYAKTGDLDILDDLTITGNGKWSTSIVGLHADISPDDPEYYFYFDRVFDIDKAGAIVKLENMSIRSGKSLCNRNGGGYGTGVISPSKM